MLVRIVVLSLVALLTGEAVSAQAVSNPTATVVTGPLGNTADSVLRSLEARGFSGVVLLAKNGEVVLQKGYGLANRSAGIPMTPSTVIQIGSNTKDFTAVAILQLVDGGKLRLDDSIGRFFASVPPDKRAITVRELLNHRAGLVNNVGEDFEPVTRNELLRRALASPLQWTPGTKESYSNLGYNLLAAIVEIVSQQSFETYLRDHMTAPLDLHDTGLLLPHFDPERIAHGYSGDEDRGTMIMKAHADDGSWWNLRGAGGLLSTVPEMYHFYAALLGTGNALLKPETRNLRFDPRQPMALAGSDLTNFFFFDHNPITGVDMILATNATRLSAPKVRDTLATAIGLNPPGGGRIARSGVATPPSDGKPFQFPDTPAGRAAAGYLRAFNSGDPEVMRKFFQDSMAPPSPDGPTTAQRVERYRGMHDDLGVLTPTAVVTSAPYQVVLNLRPSTGNDLVIITFNLEAATPHRLESLRVEVN